MLATPVRPIEIALGELAWAMVRGSLYAAAFLVVMVGAGAHHRGWALAALPGAAAGRLRVRRRWAWRRPRCMRSWQDFDYINVTQFALFLFSGTFSPPSDYPVPLQILVEATPLYHGGRADAGHHDRLARTGRCCGTWRTWSRSPQPA